MKFKPKLIYLTVVLLFIPIIVGGCQITTAELEESHTTIPTMQSTHANSTPSVDDKPITNEVDSDAEIIYETHYSLTKLMGMHILLI